MMPMMVGNGAGAPEGSLEEKTPALYRLCKKDPKLAAILGAGLAVLSQSEPGKALLTSEEPKASPLDTLLAKARKKRPYLEG